jgi:dTDP-4-dehydrorhamnose 3,5-epimerase
VNVIPTDLPGVLVLEPRVFGDERGWFFESWSERVFAESTGFTGGFVQDNHSRSARGVLRGLHYQMAPFAQGKLVRVTSGSVFDVAVDLRRGSATFGRWSGVELSADNRRQLWLPPGFAHGFCVTSESAEVLYKATAYYSPPHERCLRWDDPAIGIRWPVPAPVLAPRDAAAPLLAQAECFA